MQKNLFILIGVLSYCCVIAQQPVRWKYSSKKLNETTYELHITASIDDGWHIYAQKQPKDAIALPTKIEFNDNPLLKTDGKVIEIGKLEKNKVEALGIEQYQYSNQVDFVQLIKLKSNVKTNVSGKIAFEVCTNEQCLHPTEVPFTIAL